MELNLDGKRALVTGSTSGIGYAIAQGLAEAGAAVILNGRSEYRLAKAIERLRNEIPQSEVDGCAADVGEAASVERLIAAYPDVDILVNNAGPIEAEHFFEISDQQWEQFLQVIVMAAVRLSRHHAQRMMRRGWGRVLFNASMTGGFLSGETVHYGAAKAALLGLSRGLAETTAGSGVTVNAFVPGPTHSEQSFMAKAPHARPGKSFEEIERELFEGALGSSLIKRFISPTEIANLVVFLASERSSAITGAALRVDGGIVRTLV